MSRAKYGTTGDKTQAQLDDLKAEVTKQAFSGLSGRIDALTGQSPDQLRAQVGAHARQNQVPSVFENVPTGSTITPTKLPSEQKSSNLEFYVSL